MPVEFVFPDPDAFAQAAENLQNIETQLRRAERFPDRFAAEIKGLEERHAVAKAEFEAQTPTAPDPIVDELERTQAQIENAIAAKEVQRVLEGAGDTDAEKLEAIRRELERRKQEEAIALELPVAATAEASPEKQGATDGIDKSY